MFPQSTENLGMDRQVSTMKPMDRTFNFSGIQQHNAYTKQLGKLIMDKLQMHTLDFDWAPPQRDIWTKTLNDMGLQLDIQGRQELYPRGEADENGNVSLESAVANGDERRTNVENGAMTI